ncbi:MAG: glycosyltransferase [Alphaproteobacteria bacterium]
MPRIAVIYQGIFQYDAVNAFAQALAEGFDALGFQTVVLDTKNDEPGARARLGELLTRPERIAFILGPGGILADAAVGGQNLYGRFNVPYVAYLVDHPTYLLMRLAKAQNALVTCIDRAHVDFLNAIGIARAAYVPHGAALPDRCRPWDERSGGIAFAASTSDDAALREHVISELDPAQRDLMASIAEDPAIDTLSAVEAAVRAHPRAAGLGWTAGYDGSLIIFLNEADRLIRRRRRNRIVRELDEAGVALDLYGRGWERFGFRHHRTHAPLDFPEMCAALQTYRCALHLNPLFTAGLHERLLSAAVAGCAVITDGNAEIDRLFPDGTAAIRIRPAQADWAEALVARLAGNDLAAVAAEGRRITARGESWAHRAGAIAALVDNYWPERARG